MWLLVKSGSLLMICLMAELRESPTRALQARARIRSASVMGIFTDSRDSSTWRRHEEHEKHFAFRRSLIYNRGHHSGADFYPRYPKRIKPGKFPLLVCCSYLYPIVVLHHLPHVGQHPVVRGGGLLGME